MLTTCASEQISAARHGRGNIDPVAEFSPVPEFPLLHFSFFARRTVDKSAFFAGVNIVFFELCLQIFDFEPNTYPTP
jgi:hypothetical protein